MSESELIISRAGPLASIRLNRPAALNSLTLGMVRGMTAALDAFAADAEIVAVLVTGAGDRAFCAGGDIRSLYEMRGSDQADYKTFWREEYALNAFIASYRKPYVVMMDGVVMGGGVGVSAHGSHRIVTERTRLAMPEASIGFIPDVGGSWLLTRKGGAGRYMALSGATVGVADAIQAGLADAMIDSARIDEFAQTLGGVRRAADVDDVISRFSRVPPDAPLAAQAALLDLAMAAPTVEEIIAALSAADTAFARAAVDAMTANSPTSLKVTQALLLRAAQAERLEQCLVDEFRAACRLLRAHDLYEGIRAAIIDKDKTPRWRPAALSDVNDETVRAILAGTDDPDPVFRERARA